MRPLPSAGSPWQALCCAPVAVADADLDALYGAPFDEFVARRNALEKSLRKEGHDAEANAVKALTKPSLPAWTVNQLLRHEPKRFAVLVEAGEALRDAQRGMLHGGGGDAMRTATRAQREAVSALVERAAALLEKAGHKATATTMDKVNETLQAVSTVGWGEAGEGRLERELAPPGLDALAGLFAGGAPASGHRAPRKPAAAKRARDGEGEDAAEDEADEKRSAREEAAARRAEKREADRREAEQALRAAERVLSSAKREATHADGTLEKAETRADVARTRVADAEQALEAARAQLEKAGEAVKEAKAEARERRDELSAAERAVSAAERALEKLQGDD
jgi:hypothetical protein